MALPLSVSHDPAATGARSLERKRVTVVSAATGSGHDSVARSLSRAFDRLGDGEVTVEVIDLLGQKAAPIFRLGGLYAPIIVRYPRLWGPIYWGSDNERFFRLFRRAIGATWGTELAPFFRSRAPHAIVCVHPLGNQIVAECLRRTRWPSPLITVITDLSLVHTAWVAPEVGLYVAPTDEVREGLLAKGVEAWRVKTLGLPLDERFLAGGTDRQEFRRRLGLDEKLFTILLTGGGEGAGAVFEVAQTISKAGLPVQLIIACGRNGALRRKLEACPPFFPHVLLGFQASLAQWMKAVDVIIGKAGALTIGEAIAAQKPIIIFGALPGQESGNADFVRRRGMGRVASSVSGVVNTLEHWIDNPESRDATVAKGAVYRGEWSQAAARTASATLQAIYGRELEPCLDHLNR